jgi:RNA polymerase sigma-70 factor (ECF subfamily)
MEQTRQSLLVRAQTGDEAAWKELTALYRPLILGWLGRHGVPGADRDDLTQDVLVAVVKSLPTFQHSGNRGAFRTWLRTMICHRTSDYWRAGDGPARGTGGSGAVELLRQVEDADSDLSRRWDEEHDRYLFRYLVDRMELEFEPSTVRAFRRLAVEGASGAEVARELGLTVGAVYVAKSRVLQRLRLVAAGLIEER